MVTPVESSVLAAVGHARVVEGVLADEDGVGHGDVFVFRGEHLGGEQADLGDGALDIADAGELPGADRSGIEDDEAAHDLVDETGGAERDHQAGEHADALEGLAVRSGDVGVGDDESEDPDQHAGDPAGGAGGVPREDFVFLGGTLEAPQDLVGQADGAAGEEEEGDDDEDIGQRGKRA